MQARQRLERDDDIESAVAELVISLIERKTSCTRAGLRLERRGERQLGDQFGRLGEQQAPHFRSIRQIAIAVQTPTRLALPRSTKPLEETEQLLEQRRRFGSDRSGVDQR